jgi:hypothetical protein
MRSKTQFSYNKVSIITENHTIKAGLNFIRGDHQLFGGGNPVGNYRVKLNQNQIDVIKKQWVDLNVNDILDAQVLNYNVELRPASFGKSRYLFGLLKTYGRLLID